MTVGDTLGQTALQLQDAWTSLTATWTQTVQDLLDTTVVDPVALFRQNAAMDQMFGWAKRAIEINLDLLQDLTGVSVTAEVSVGRELTSVAATAAVPVAPPEPLIVVEPPIDVLVIEVEPVEAEAVRSGNNATRAAAAGTSSRTSKAGLQKALSDRGLPSAGTIKELRERLIGADRQTPG